MRWSIPIAIAGTGRDAGLEEIRLLENNPYIAGRIEYLALDDMDGGCVNGDGFFLLFLVALDGVRCGLDGAVRRLRDKTDLLVIFRAQRSGDQCFGGEIAQMANLVVELNDVDPGINRELVKITIANLVLALPGPGMVWQQPYDVQALLEPRGMCGVVSWIATQEKGVARDQVKRLVARMGMADELAACRRFWLCITGDEDHCTLDLFQECTKELSELVDNESTVLANICECTSVKGYKLVLLAIK